ncbi:MAG: hypothetical protein PUC12_16050 [Clostridiales bacterium]|nr:hypothetical protein [Clostridiales bacterium]
MEYLQRVVESSQMFSNALGPITILYLCALLYLIVKRKEIRYGTELVWINLLILLIVLNPTFADLYLKELVWRSYWVLPVLVVIAYAAVDFFQKQAFDWKKKLCILMGFIILCLGGFVYDGSSWSLAANPYKIPQEYIEVYDYLLQQDKDPRVVMPKGLYTYARQYSSQIKLLYGRDIEGYMWGVADESIVTLADNLMSAKPDYEQAYEALTAYQCDYLVINTKKQTKPDQVQGFRYKTTIDDYAVYQIL